MSRIRFRRISPQESRIYDPDDYVGDVYAHDDILNRGAVFYVVHLSEDPRGPVRVHDRARIRETAQRLLDSHPLL